MNIILVMGILFVVMVMIYAALAVFFPEIVGITGKKSKQVNASHEEIELFFKEMPQFGYYLTGIPQPWSISVEQEIFSKVAKILSENDLEKNEITIDFQGNIHNPHPKVTLKPR